MKKRFFALLLLLTLALAVSVTALAASNGNAAPGGNAASGGGTASDGVAASGRFSVLHTYTNGQFKDVEGSAWYATAVQAGVEYGLFDSGCDTFRPGDVLTVAEAVKLAVTLYYPSGAPNAGDGAPWYQAYVDDAVHTGIIALPIGDVSAPVTRAQFAELLARALPAGAVPAVNAVSDNAIPDVSVADSFAAAVYKLYRAGVLTGSDKFGTFRPYDKLTRAEAAVIAARAADDGFRKRIALPGALSARDIFQKCAPAVFYLERYDTEGVVFGTGSGFFISRDGLAVTNYHVIAGAAAASITLADGSMYPVKGVCGYDKTADIAVLQIEGSGFPYLDIADSSLLGVGTPVYAIGSPYGLKNSISDGIVSNVVQHLNGSDFIQFSAPISIGSGGGPILNTAGQVVGVACLSATRGQTLNFAVPINDLKDLSRTGCISLIAVTSKNTDTPPYYKSYFPVPDYGVFTGTPIYKATQDMTSGVKTYYYKLSDVTAPDNVAVGGYAALLTNNGFEWKRSYKGDDGGTVDIFYNSSFDMSVHFGTGSLKGVACRFVAIK